jgi:hypothetical protein
MSVLVSMLQSMSHSQPIGDRRDVVAVAAVAAPCEPVEYDQTPVASGHSSLACALLRHAHHTLTPSGCYATLVAHAPATLN